MECNKRNEKALLNCGKETTTTIPNTVALTDNNLLICFREKNKYSKCFRLMINHCLDSLVLAEDQTK